MKNISEFVSQINSLGGIAKSNLFRVLVTTPVNRYSGGTKTLSYLASSVTTPSMDVSTFDHAIMGPPHSLPMFNSYGGNLTVKFLSTSSFYERGFFEAWLRGIINPITQMSSYYNEIVGKVEVNRITDDGKLSLSTTYTDAYPTSLSGFDLSWSEAASPEYFSVTFAFYKIYTSNLPKAAIEVMNQNEENMEIRESKPVEKFSKLTKAANQQ